LPSTYSDMQSNPATVSFLGVEATGLPLKQIVIDGENQLILAALNALLENNVEFSPLVVYGPSATGKTETINGLIQQRRFLGKKKTPANQIHQTTAIDFSRSLVDAIDTGSVADFRSKMRRLSVLFIDDLQNLEGKSATQQELILLIDHFEQRGKFLLLTSSVLPLEIPDFSSQLASRLAKGLSIKLGLPGKSARLEILKSLASYHRVSFTPEGLKLLAERFPVTALEMNHVIVQIAAERRVTDGKSSVQSQPDNHGNNLLLDTEWVTSFVNRQMEKKTPTVKNICSRVAKTYKLKNSDLTGSSRKSTVVRARGIAIYLSRKLTPISLEQLGKFFGRRDHTTVLHACRKTESLLKEDREIRSIVEKLKSQLE